ncbi:MAG: hypothetical protein KAX19_09555 [Candidatus Brocadiae bacterium]|nr:hypothetical protein [Candidatus Brocadiia bacterium]
MAEELGAAINRYEDVLFGIRLYHRQIEVLYSQDAYILKTSEYHFKHIVRRGGKALSKARKLLRRLEQRTPSARTLAKAAALKFFLSPPWRSDMEERALLLAQTYQKLFGDRPRDVPLTPEEHGQLMDEAAERWEPNESFGGW